MIKYSSAQQNFKAGEYEKSYTQFKALGNYKDSEEKMLASKYKIAGEYFKIGNFSQASAEYESLKNYKDSETMMLESQYEIFKQWLEEGNYYNTLESFKPIIKYKDNDKYNDYYEKAANLLYLKAIECFDNSEFNYGYAYFLSLKGYKESDEYLLKILK